MTRSELLARIYVLLGGRVAEEMIFNDVSTGAQNDLQKATEIARTMVAQFGMSERFGFCCFGGAAAAAFLSRRRTTLQGIQRRDGTHRRRRDQATIDGRASKSAKLFVLL
jgi:ATP-dependent Zn protease